MAANVVPVAGTIARLACFAAVGVLSACFDPHYRMLRCSAARECPDHGQCGADGFCVDPSLPGAVVDAAIDMAIDVQPPPPDAAVCVGGSFLMVCLPQRPAVPLVLASQTFDTSDPACMTTASVTPSADICVLAGTTIEISGQLRATGARPLVLVAFDSISIQSAGTIDVSSHVGAVPEIGAGADHACAAGTPPTTVNNSSGGGGGGSFATAGGRGGIGGSTSPGAAGIAGGSLALDGVRGGCPGQGGAGSQGGSSGHGGGAVYLIAQSSIDVSGTILAGGEGGGGGGVGNCGGGGGSGGLIGFDAPQITGAGLVVAGGGGGGEGGGAATSVGLSGGDGTTLMDARGGDGGAVSGGDGGDGSVGAPGAGGNPGGGMNGGGGGGGGGAGYIRSSVALGDIRVAPPATVVP